MLVNRIKSVVLLLIAMTMTASAYGQHAGFFGKSDDNSDFTGLYDPFCDLDTCWFEPISCDCPDRPLNSGWFFGYRRVNMNVSRPQNQTRSRFYEPLDDVGAVRPDDELLESIYTGQISGDLSGDWGWGNRFDFGWISEEGSGLWFVARKLDGPNESVSFDNIDTNDLALNRLDEQPFGPTSAVLNGLRMWGFEANKTWRLTRTARGTVIEPFVGARYMRLRDISDRNDVFSDAFSVLSRIPLTGATTLRRLSFAYRQNQLRTDNDLFGGQFGMRSRWQRGRWQVSSDIRGLMFFNHQSRENIITDERQSQDWIGNYDAAGQLTTIAPLNGTVVVDERQVHVTDTNSTFAYGGELNLELSFAITQGFAINAGTEIIAIGDGIGRGLQTTDDSLLMSGFSFGFTYNR